MRTQCTDATINVTDRLLSHTEEMCCFSPVIVCSFGRYTSSSRYPTHEHTGKSHNESILANKDTNLRCFPYACNNKGYWNDHQRIRWKNERLYFFDVDRHCLAWTMGCWQYHLKHFVPLQIHAECSDRAVLRTWRILFFYEHGCRLWCMIRSVDMRRSPVWAMKRRTEARDWCLISCWTTETFVFITTAWGHLRSSLRYPVR